MVLHQHHHEGDDDDKDIKCPKDYGNVNDDGDNDVDVKGAVSVFKNPNFSPFQSSSVLPIRGICCFCYVILTFL